MEQVRRLATFVAEHAALLRLPAADAATGDLNAEPGSDQLRLLGGVLTAPAVPGLVLRGRLAVRRSRRPRIHLA